MAYENLKGHYLECLTARYGNYIKGKLYLIDSKRIHLYNKQPAEFFVTDEDHDTMHVESLLRRPGEFKIISKE